MLHTRDVEKMKTKHFIFSNFFFENRVVYEIIWKNRVKPDRPEMVIKYGACALHAVYRRLQIHTQNM
jgi:hypothetical protein